jgi:hypothetical protein
MTLRDKTLFITGARRGRCTCLEPSHRSSCSSTAFELRTEPLAEFDSLGYNQARTMP